jgi:hypothetical protein
MDTALLTRFEGMSRFIGGAENEDQPERPTFANRHSQ